MPYLLRGIETNDPNRHQIIANAVTINFHNGTTPKGDAVKSLFYFRSTYRHEGDLQVNSLSKLPPIIDDLEQFRMMSQDDKTVTKNYQRLVGSIVTELHSKDDDHTPKGEWRDTYYQPLQEAMNRIFGGLLFESPGDPMSDGTFFFTKGAMKSFRYGNLSSGEKAVFDLILDLYVRGKAFTNAIFCIDEPESHVNTNLQGILLEELYRFVPTDGQLWMATHSIGIIRKAMEMQAINPNEVIFLDFHTHDFDDAVTLSPAKVTTSFWLKNLQTTFADLGALVAPVRVVLCVGSPMVRGIKNAEFDAKCYQIIFENEFPETLFISVGGSNDVLTQSPALRSIIAKIAQGIEIVSLVDRDERTENEIQEANNAGTRVLPKRHLEHYLLCEEVLSALCTKAALPQYADIIIEKRRTLIDGLVANSHQPDDVKKIKGDLYNYIKTTLRESNIKFGSNADVFCRDVLAPLIDRSMVCYAELRSAIFGK